MENVSETFHNLNAALKWKVRVLCPSFIYHYKVGVLQTLINQVVGNRAFFIPLSECFKNGMTVKFRNAKKQRNIIYVS